MHLFLLANLVTTSDALVPRQFWQFRDEKHETLRGTPWLRIDPDASGCPLRLSLGLCATLRQTAAFFDGICDGFQRTWRKDYQRTVFNSVTEFKMNMCEDILWEDTNECGVATGASLQHVRMQNPPQGESSLCQGEAAGTLLAPNYLTMSQQLWDPVFEQPEFKLCPTQVPFEEMLGTKWSQLLISNSCKARL